MELKKVLAVMSSVTLILCGCEAASTEEKNSTGSQAPISVEHNEPKDNISVSQGSSVSEVAEISENNTVCTLFCDDKYHYNGTEFDDPELCDRAKGFIDTVTGSYEPLSGEALDEYMSLEQPKGEYVKAVLSDDTEIYIPTERWEYVRIDAQVYETDGGESSELAGYIKTYLSKHIE